MNPLAMSAAALVAFGLCVGCGGGAGSDHNDFAGRYHVRLVTTENTCTFSVDPEDRDYLVNQDGSRVVVDRDAENGLVYEGTTTGDDSFVVSAVGTDVCVRESDGQPDPGSTYQYTDTIEVTRTGDREAQFTFTEDDGDCTNDGLHDNTCHYMMVGTATITPP